MANNSKTSWKLFLDDERNPRDVFADGDEHGWTVARSTEEAKKNVLAQGWPERIAFDHDLGYSDTAVIFLRWFIDWCFDNDCAKVPRCTIHSQNPEGVKNLRSILYSWKKTLMEDKVQVAVKVENLE